jgi:hypothetical protein
MKHCCKLMDYYADYRCEQHPNPFDCPDNVIYFSEKAGYGLIVHDGGESFLKIAFCPWCGSKLFTTGPQADESRATN